MKNTLLAYAKQAHGSLVRNNPVLDYLNRRSWHRWRRWGWLLALIPLILAGWHLTIEAMFAMYGPPEEGMTPGFLSFFFVGGTYWAFAILAVSFSLGGIAKLLRPERVEPLFLTPIAPMQFWTAAWIHFNRNLLVLGALILPFFWSIGIMTGHSLALIVNETVLMIAFPNLWFLVFAVIAAQAGFRFMALRCLALLTVLAFGFLGFFVVSIQSSSGFDPVGWPAVFHPFCHWARNFMPVIQETFGNRDYFPPEMPTYVLGHTMPFEIVAPLSLASLAAVMLLVLITGPAGLPATQEEKWSRRRRKKDKAGHKTVAKEPKSQLGLGKISDIAPKPIISRGPFAWSQIIGRIYENAPPFVKRRRYLAKNISAMGLWLFFVLLIVEITHAVDNNTFNRGSPDPIGVMSDGAAIQYVGVLMAAGLLAGFHFAFAGRGKMNPNLERPEPSLRHRTVAYGCKMAAAVAIVWIAGASRPSAAQIPADLSDFLWIFHKVPPKILLFAILIVLSQLAFQLWASSRSRTPRQALANGCAHLLALWLGPLIPAVFGSWLPKAGAYIVLFIASFSPLIGWFDLAGRGETLSIGLEGGYERVRVDAQWGLAALLLFCELAIFGSLWIRNTLAKSEKEREVAP